MNVAMMGVMHGMNAEIHALENPLIVLEAEAVIRLLQMFVLSLELLTVLIAQVVIVILVIVAIVLAGCGSAEPTPHPGEALVASKCSTCHGIAQVNNADYSRDVWQSTVERMKLHGLSVTTEEESQIVDYLATRNSQ